MMTVGYPKSQTVSRSLERSLLFFLLELIWFERRIDLDLLKLDLFSDLAAVRPSWAMRQGEAVDVAVVGGDPAHFHFRLLRLGLRRSIGRTPGLFICAPVGQVDLVGQHQYLMRLLIYEKPRCKVVR